MAENINFEKDFLACYYQIVQTGKHGCIFDQTHIYNSLISSGAILQSDAVRATFMILYRMKILDYLGADIATKIEKFKLSTLRYTTESPKELKAEQIEIDSTVNEMTTVFFMVWECLLNLNQLDIFDTESFQNIFGAKAQSTSIDSALSKLHMMELISCIGVDSVTSLRKFILKLPPWSEMNGPDTAMKKLQHLSKQANEEVHHSSRSIQNHMIPPNQTESVNSHKGLSTERTSDTKKGIATEQRNSHEFDNELGLLDNQNVTVMPETVPPPNNPSSNPNESPISGPTSMPEQSIGSYTVTFNNFIGGSETAKSLKTLY